KAGSSRMLPSALLGLMVTLRNGRNKIATLLCKEVAHRNSLPILDDLGDLGLIVRAGSALDY
ncbi:MAG: hypothetical protein WCD79_14720, partial [Chthoniobacteraceae bacterium]